MTCSTSAAQHADRVPYFVLEGRKDAHSAILHYPPELDPYLALDGFCLCVVFEAPEGGCGASRSLNAVRIASI